MSGGAQEAAAGIKPNILRSREIEHGRRAIIVLFGVQLQQLSQLGPSLHVPLKGRGHCENLQPGLAIGVAQPSFLRWVYSNTRQFSNLIPELIRADLVEGKAFFSPDKYRYVS
jgi:hypothetical protein